MFTRDDAKSLREALAPLDFYTPCPESDLLQSYFAQYGLQDSLPAHNHRIGTFNSGEYLLVGQYFGLTPEQQKGCVFLLHGYYDHLGLYSHLIAHCLAQGYAVLGFDLPGHGLSSGDEASINSFREYVAAVEACCNYVEAQIEKPWIAIGQSTGGAIIMDFLLEGRADLFDKHILFCPLLYTRNWQSSRLLFFVTRWFVSSIKRTFAKNSHDKKFLNFIRHQDPLQSQKLPVPWVAAMNDYHHRFNAAGQNNTLIEIVQGTGDTTVDWQRNMELIQEKFPQSNTLLIPDARHHLVNESQEYRGQAFARITEVLLKESV